MTLDRPRHVPVMAGDVLAFLLPAPDRVLLDLTVGAGGHAEAFLQASAPTGRVLGVDRDATALELARARLAPFGARARLVHGDFVTALARLSEEGLRPDAVLADLGVSSMQLDDPARGFSLREDALLDMRMDSRQGATAADLLNRASEDELVQMLRDLADEPAAERLARAFVARRRERPFRSTGDLRVVVETTLGSRGGRIHPATRTFQALRMAVNDELGQLTAMLPAALERLAPGGRLVVLSFHSGEDRIVKDFFARAAREGHELLTRRPQLPGRDEQRTNRRSRSARLRALAKGGPPSP
jgi:16S rRNA (cytosine1402-N4)-methyltransferase